MMVGVVNATGNEPSCSDCIINDLLFIGMAWVLAAQRNPRGAGGGDVFVCGADTVFIF